MKLRDLKLNNAAIVILITHVVALIATIIYLKINVFNPNEKKTKKSYFQSINYVISSKFNSKNKFSFYFSNGKEFHCYNDPEYEGVENFDFVFEQVKSGDTLVKNEYDDFIILKTKKKKYKLHTIMY